MLNNIEAVKKCESLFLSVTKLITVYYNSLNVRAYYSFGDI